MKKEAQFIADYLMMALGIVMLSAWPYALGP